MLLTFVRSVRSNKTNFNHLASPFMRFRANLIGSRRIEWGGVSSFYFRVGYLQKCQYLENWTEPPTHKGCTVRDLNTEFLNLFFSQFWVFLKAASTLCQDTSISIIDGSKFFYVKLLSEKIRRSPGTSECWVPILVRYFLFYTSQFYSL